MALFTLFAAVEASVLSVSWFKRADAHRTELLHGNETKLLSLPVIDNRLAQETDTAARFQIFAAERISEISRRVVHTRAFELCVLRLIQSATLRLRHKSSQPNLEVI